MPGEDTRRGDAPSADGASLHPADPPAQDGNAEARIGSHLLLDGWGAPYAVLNDSLRVRLALQATVTAAGLTLLRIVLEPFVPQGVTGIALLAESHLAIHTWPERGVFAADLFHCGTLPATDLGRELAFRLDAPSWRHRVVERIASPDARITP